MIQLQFLNYLLTTKDYSIISLNNITEDYFSEYRDEFRFIKYHNEQYGNVPDFPTFLVKFPKFDVLDVKENPNFLLKELVQDLNTRRLATTFNRVRNYLMNNQIEEAMEAYKRANENLVNTNVINSVDIIHDTHRYDDYVKRLNNFDKYFVKTGFKELDNIIGGWDKEEELAVIVARSGMGKSWFLLKSALAAAEQGLIVGLYSGEMSEKKVGYRIDTLLGHISNGALIHGNESVQADYQEHIKSLSNKVKGDIKVITPLSMNGPATVSALRAFIEKEKLDILFIDQLSLLDDERHARNPVERATNISKDLKILQTLKKIPIISVSQQNRSKLEGDEDIIDTSQLSMSDRIGQDATSIIGIMRDKKDNHVFKLYVVKSRDNENNAKLSYYVDLNLGKFKFIPETDSDLEDSRYDVENNDGEDVF